MASIDMAKYMADRRAKRRAQVIELLGGCCVVCGTTENLDVDHVDAKQMSFRLNGKALDRRWEEILKEAKKCQLLCKQHHHEKTAACGDCPPPVNKGIDKNGLVIPEHGHSARYATWCRCDLCRTARYEDRVLRGDSSGARGQTSQTGVIVHGTSGGYQKELRQGFETCSLCRAANAARRRA